MGSDGLSLGSCPNRQQPPPPSHTPTFTKKPWRQDTKRLETISWFICLGPAHSWPWSQRLEALPCQGPSMRFFWNSPWGRNLRPGGEEVLPLDDCCYGHGHSQLLSHWLIPVLWAAGLVACGCGQAMAGHGHFKDSLHLKLWHREGGGQLSWCQQFQ